MCCECCNPFWCSKCDQTCKLECDCDSYDDEEDEEDHEEEDENSEEG